MRNARHDSARDLCDARFGRLRFLRRCRLALGGAAVTDRTEGRYSVYVGPREMSLCECRRFFATGKCKHITALATVIAAGEL